MKRTFPVFASNANVILAKIALMTAIFGTSLTLSPAFGDEQTLGFATTPDGKVRIDIVSLKRTEGETMTLYFKITNSGNDVFSPVIGNARLIDMIGRRIYSPGLESPSCRASVGERLSCYAVFGAPPAGTKKLNVQFYEKIDLISGIPLSEQ